MSVLDLARPEIRALTPYASARMEAGAAAVMLNANESPWPASDGLNRYPEPQPLELRRRLADLYGVGGDQILLGRGSDEAMDLLVRAFCRPGLDAIAICPPTFGMYAVCAGVQGAGIVRIPLDERFALDADAVLEACTPAVKLLFLCSPNNPTGGVIACGTIEHLVRALADRSLVIVDEAYIEFADTPSVADLLARYSNLAVLRTLSKAWALAGARIGALLADAGIVDLLRRIMPPYPLPTPSVHAALEALGDDGERRMLERVAMIRGQRERLCKTLCEMPEVREVLPSQANFIVARFDDAQATYRRLAAQGIVVRDVSRYPGLANCLRISIGTPAENNSLLTALAPPRVGACPAGDGLSLDRTSRPSPAWQAPARGDSARGNVATREGA
ncbi:MAG TPA: histidinol-phosphate transaminase [Rhodanobacteraceae bacterium]|nr:histidinol-phosphate transaminase [Rhodanobacteraceae bacterium]